MLYKIEFLTIEKMKIKKDYEVYNVSGWKSAVDRFVNHEKYYFPIWILSVKYFDQDLAMDYPDNDGWLRDYDVDIDKLNIDLGYSIDYNGDGL